MRIGKVLRFSNTRTVVSIDLYNALNSDAMIVQNQAYLSYLRPVEILNARLIKFSWAFDLGIRNQESGIAGAAFGRPLLVLYNASYADGTPRCGRRSTCRKIDLRSYPDDDRASSC